MIKYRPAIASILFLFLIVLSILIWRASLLFINLNTMLPAAETNPEVELNTEATDHIKKINLTSPLIINKGNSVHNETIEQSIARIKRDVVVTGTFIGTAGAESALFQIKDKPDQSFNISAQLMDGFIITEITQNQVILKNQSGDESFFIPVQSSHISELIQTDLINSELLSEHEPKPLHESEPIELNPTDAGYHEKFGFPEPDPIGSRIAPEPQYESEPIELNPTDAGYHEKFGLPEPDPIGSRIAPEPQYESELIELNPTDAGYRADPINSDTN